MITPKWNIFGFTVIILLEISTSYATLWNANSFLNSPTLSRKSKKTSEKYKLPIEDDYLVSEGKDSELPPEFLLTDSQEIEIFKDFIRADIRDTRQSSGEDSDAGETEQNMSSTEPNLGHLGIAPSDPVGFGLFISESDSDDNGTENAIEAVVSIPDFPYSVCGENTDEGIKACESSCTSKVYNCIGKQCFCSEHSEDGEDKTDDDQLPKKSPFYVCGENNYGGSLICRRNCNLLRDLVVCAGKYCYCNLFKSTPEFLEPMTSGHPNPKHPKRTDEIIFEDLKPSPVLSQYDCYIGNDKETQITRHETCIKECSYMKEYDPKGAILLTCNNNNAICKCISFLPLTKLELQNLLDNNDHKTPTIDPPRKCRGYMCLIEAYLTQGENEVKETLSESEIKNYVYCGPNSELGFTKCRDICTFEKAGVVRCGGFSCYCHYGSVPMIRNEIGKEAEDSGKMKLPFKSRFMHCGKDKSECQSVCQYIGEIICGRLGCYCDSGL